MSDELGVLSTNKNGTNNNIGGDNIDMSPFQQTNDTVGSPQHNYRHSRAYRHFKNPPQPHMCIRTTTIPGEELFINVLSWTRIVIPQEPSDPIPLYGGMRVPPGSPRCPPLVYAVMANPEVLKDSGRHSKDPEERRAMVELMCDFVEAMNPDVKLTRNAVILKDRDISGELKDVWNAVQAQRDREREEQITQQQRQQQQHYHNVTTQQMFPKNPQQTQQIIQQQPPCSIATIESDESSKVDERNENETGTGTGTDNNILYMDFDPENKSSSTAIPISSNNSKIKENNEISLTNPNVTGAQSAINNMANLNLTYSDKDNDKSIITTLTNKNNLNNSDDVTDSTKSQQILENQTNILKSSSTSSTTIINNTAIQQVNSLSATNEKDIKLNNSNSNQKIQINNSTANNNSSVTTNSSNAINTSTTTTTNTNTTTPATPTKKEKLGGFLPNGCIFPRFKNNKHKEKDKDKDNTKSSSNKEKTLLNSLKKVTLSSSKSQHHQDQQQQQLQQENKSQQYEKNCINLEDEIEKLDLNKLDSTGANEMVIKVKVASSGAK